MNLTIESKKDISMRHGHRYHGGRLTFGYRFSLLFSILITLGNIHSWSADYVITQNGHYLSYNGSLKDATTFDPATCIWSSTITNGGSGKIYLKSNNSIYLRYNSGLTTGNSGNGTTFYLQNDTRLCRTRNYNYYSGYQYSNYIRYDGGWKADGSAQDNISAVTITTVNAEDNFNLTVNCYNNPLTFSTKTTTIQAGSNGSYSPASTNYYFSYRNHYLYNGSLYEDNKPIINSLSDGCVVKWSLASEDAAYASINENTGLLTYQTASPTNVTVTVTATVTHPNFLETDFKKTKSIQVTLQADAANAGYTVTVNQATGGTISANPTTAKANDQVSLTATPNAGYNFTSWNVRDASNQPVTVTNNRFTMPASNVTVTATFSAIDYSVTVNQPARGGTISANPTTANVGTQVSLTATPDDGYSFTAWNVKDANNQTITVTGNKFTMPAGNVTVSATFTADNYTVTVNQAAGGTISANPTSGNKGAEITLTATPNAGYSFTSWNVRNASNQSITVTNNKFTMPSSNVTVTATFTPVTYTVTVNNPEGGTISASPTSGIVGTQISLTATPSDGYEFNYWNVRGGNNSAVPVNNDKFNLPASNVTVTAVFSRPSDAPEITFDNVTGLVSISTNTPGATIHYTIDGSTPTNVSATYSDPFEITDACTVKAYTVADGYNNSTIAKLVIEKVAAPVISINAQDLVEMTCSTEGAAIYYKIEDGNFTIYSSPVSVGSGKTVTAEARKRGSITSTNASRTVELICEKPDISKSGTNLIMSSSYPTSGITIRYTTNGSEPTSSSTAYSGAVNTGSWSLPVTVKAKTFANGYSESETTSYVVSGPMSGQGTEASPYIITNNSQLEDFITAVNNNSAAGKYYKVADGVKELSAPSATTRAFTGSFDGNYAVISGLSHALFSSINGGTVKNVIVDNVTISGATVGAIANEAGGNTRIYNCGVLSTNNSSSISGTGSVGGIAGQIDGNTKVVNCYNYATISGGDYAAGIVGRNGGGSASSYSYTNDCSSLTGWTTSTNVNTTQGGNPHFFVNTWSTEGNNDGSGMTTPFIEYWRGAGNNLANTYIRYTITGVPAGTYTVSILVRMYNESNTNNPSGISFYTNGDTEKTVNIAGTLNTSNNHRLRYATVSTDVSVNANGQLTVGFNVNNAQNCNWLAFKNLTVRPQGGGTASNTRISNCMMYGDLTSGTHRSPVYGGSHTSNNRNFTEYNYYRSRANLTYTAYNDQLAIDKDEFLTRFPFYRHIQNTHREMAAYFLFGDHTTAHNNEIGHWVLKPEIAPYPIIEPWATNTKKTTEEIRNNLPNTTDDYAGKLLGNLTVNVRINGSNYQSSLPVTDMDTAKYDFTWGKVVLPFANEYSGWTRDYRVICTGWKITSITGGTAGSLTNYNFADRDCTAKDLYSNSNYIYAQGGNFIVPTGVTAITIEANFATAFYLSDPTYDIGYDASYANPNGLGGNVSTTYHGQTVYTNLATLIGDMSNKTNPHEQAIVLVGNYHYNQQVNGTIFNTAKGLTIMSVDEDNNQEPDYGWYSYHTTDRTDVPAMRFDFVPNIGIGMAARVTNSTPYPTIGIWHGHGWFELTETCVSFMSECEINSYSFDTDDDGKGNNRWIANSGYFTQIVRARDGNCTKLSYIQIGGNAYVKELYPGSHTDNARTTTLRPIIVNGGEIEECYMTGYHSSATATGNNIYFWSAGGKMHKWLGAYLERPSTTGVNVTAKIDHAIIGRFFGGGTSTSARITGNINVTINNSLVDFYCGGPEFGDMATGKTVTTIANGTTFGEFYGAGYGGTSITYQRNSQSYPDFGSNLNFPEAFTNYTGNRLQSGTLGIGSSYKFEYIMYSGGNGSGVARFYTGYASFSLAQTGSVTSTLNNCTVLKNFYGGGCQGTVSGNATSTLTSCHIEGNAFAGGYKAPATTVDVYPATQPTYSVYTKETGLFSDFGTVEPETYTWQYRATAGADAQQKILYTTTNLDDLGAVTGNATITIEGDTYVGGIIDGQTTGGVFGGGNESPVKGKTEVNINSNTTYKIANVYGGANKADVGNNTVVNVTSGTVGNVFGANNVSGTKNGTVTVNINQGNNKTVSITDNVYGGGNLAAYNGNPQVNIQNGTIQGAVFGGGLGTTATTGNTTVNVTGGSVLDAVYGGGALANTGNTTVNLNGGTVHDVYGGGLGRLESDEEAAVAATVQNTIVNIGSGTIGSGGNASSITGSCIITGSVFGCNNLNGTPTGNATVNVFKTNSQGGNGYHVHAVYGGGNMAAYDPEPALGTSSTKSTLVRIFGCDNSIQYVYGGGNAASAPATHLLIWGGDFDWVFGGGNGKTEEGQPENPGANVGYYTDLRQNVPGAPYGTGTAQTEIHDGEINHLFGGSNTKGNIRYAAITQLEHGDCEFYIGEAYSAGNEAYMDGTAEMKIGCIPGMGVLYGGARKADIRNDIQLTVTSGTYGQIFGGNNESGYISGTITVNIEETGCHNIIIGEIYGGGNLAPYTAPDGHGPTVNAYSFTEIGAIYGGGYGQSATVTGDTHVNIQQLVGTPFDITPAPTAMGVIGDVFGGGNSASVEGNTYVNIGNEEKVTFQSVNENKIKDVLGANIKAINVTIPKEITGLDDDTVIHGSGNIYGGGNEADVTGQTHIEIGR